MDLNRLTVSDLIEITGLSRQKLQKLNLPYYQDGKRKYYRLREVIQHITKLSIDGSETTDAKLRKIQLECKKLEIEIGQKSGQLIPQDLVIEWLADNLNIIRTNLTNIPNSLSDSLAPITDKDKIKEILTKSINHSLTTLVIDDLQGRIDQYIKELDEK